MHGEGPGEVRQLNWVYDCGTAAGPDDEVLHRAIDRIAPDRRPRQRIDLLVLSHFDTDHIAGVKELLRRCDVGTLLLPYVSYIDRMLVAVLQDVPDSAALQFFSAPTSALMAAAEGRIERILYVQGGSEPPPPPPEGGEEDFPFDPGSPMPLNARTESLPTEPPDEDASALAFHAAGLGTAPGGGDSRKVELLKAGEILTLADVWEFVPYNDEKQAHLFQNDFINEIRGDVEKMCKPSDNDGEWEAIQRIKEMYENKVGSESAYNKNLISLFLGLRPAREKPFYLDRAQYSDGWKRDFIYYDFHRRSAYSSHTARFRYQGAYYSMLLTGDGFLNREKRIAPFEERFRKPDAASPVQPLAFQVMHHGSKSNYRPGIAERISPVYSVFSSDPYGYYHHPHSEVWHEFEPYGAVQLKKGSYWRLDVLYRRR